MRLGWTTKILPNGPELEMHDLEAIVTDKDGEIHTVFFAGKVGSDWNDNPYARDPRWDADSYFERREYVETEAGLKIPRCNIKNVRYKEINHRKEQPMWHDHGIPDWDIMEKFAAIMLTGIIGLVLLCVLL